MHDDGGTRDPYGVVARTYGWLAVGVGLSILVCLVIVLVTGLPPTNGRALALVACMVMKLAIAYSVRDENNDVSRFSPSTPIQMLVLYAFSHGVCLAFWLDLLWPDPMGALFVVAASAMCAACVYGHTTARDLSDLRHEEGLLAVAAWYGRTPMPRPFPSVGFLAALAKVLLSLPLAALHAQRIRRLADGQALTAFPSDAAEATEPTCALEALCLLILLSMLHDGLLAMLPLAGVHP